MQVSWDGMGIEAVGLVGPCQPTAMGDYVEKESAGQVPPVPACGRCVGEDIWRTEEGVVCVCGHTGGLISTCSTGLIGHKVVQNTSWECTSLSQSKAPLEPLHLSTSWSGQVLLAATSG